MPCFVHSKRVRLSLDSAVGPFRNVWSTDLGGEYIFVQMDLVGRCENEVQVPITVSTLCCRSQTWRPT